MTSQRTGRELRVVSYNLHSLKDDRGALIAVVRDLAPDVLLLQEAPRRFRWRPRCAALARAFGLVMAVGGMPGLGNLVLTDLRVAVTETWCLRFPLTPGRHLRGAALARCRVAGGSFLVAGSHLATDPVERPDQAGRLRTALTEAAAAEPDQPPLVGADLNDEPGSATWSALVAGLVDPGDGSPTFPATGPRRRIDAVFVDPRVEVRGYQVVDTPAARRASDHLPVVADLRL